MIQIEDLHIQEFRGIRDLRLKLGCKSFVIWGPNGSGKSGVIDAIEFVLTGSISRLSGTGSGGLTLLRHGPHVHRRDDPRASQVSATIYDTTSGKTALLTRNIKMAKQYVLEPDIPEVRAAIDNAGQHPEITLSRREVIKYIVAEASKRSQEVQILLKLDRLGEIRSVFRTVQTRTGSAEKAAQAQVDTSEDALRRHLDLSTLLETQVTSAINKHRRVLGLALLDSLKSDTQLNEGVDADSGPSAFNKVSAIRDVSGLVNRLAEPTVFAAAVKSLNEALDVLEEDPSIFSALQHRGLVNAGLALVTDSHCPLCDADWPDVDALRSHLAEKLERSEKAAKLQEQILRRARDVISASQDIRGLVTTAKPMAAAHGAAGLHTQLQMWSNDLVAFETQLGSLDGALGQRSRLTGNPLKLPAEAGTGLRALLETLEAMPDQSATANARSFLIIAQERWAALRVARADLRKKAAAHTAARVVYETYCSVSDKVLTKLYEAVEDQFSAYYRELNADDESAFKAHLEPSASKLELSVDFYGLGMFPPAAYHSEGHQDGMGVCLYLALIQRLLGSDFRFAALDDVVMSIDSSHRKRFCNLLKTRFADVQFIITTHDEVWARQMQSSGLVAKVAQAKFHSWTVDGGPVYEEANFWDKVDSDLSKDDVSAAAARLRRNLELVLADLAENLHGQVAYRADGNYDLGDFLAAVNGGYKKWLGQAAKSANHWNDEAAKLRVKDLQDARSVALLEQQTETWPINPAVHFNEWANFASADFRPVVTAWKKFLDLYICSNDNCRSCIYVTGPSGHEEALRCQCGGLNLNLRTK